MGPAWVAIEAQLAAHEAALVASSVDVCWSKSSIVFVTIVIIFLSGLISLPQIQILFHVIMYTYCSLTAVITLIITEYDEGTGLTSWRFQGLSLYCILILEIGRIIPINISFDLWRSHVCIETFQFFLAVLTLNPVLKRTTLAFHSIMSSLKIYSGLFWGLWTTLGSLGLF